MGFYKKKKPEAGSGFIKKIQDPNWDSARNPVIYNFIITKISSYIYIYNVINPKIYIPHPHFISAHNPPLSSLYSLVSLVTHKSQSHSLTLSLTNHNLTHSQSHLRPTTQPFTADLSLRHRPKLCQCHRSSSSDLADKHLKRSSASPHEPHLARPSSTSQGHNSLIFLTSLWTQDFALKIVHFVQRIKFVFSSLSVIFVE